jgi:xanthine dehydrogenase accessory factor
VSLQADFFALARGGERGALLTVVEPIGDGRPGTKMLVRPDGSTAGSLGATRLDLAGVDAALELMWKERSAVLTLEGAGVFVDVTAPPPRLLIFGAIDFAGALSRVARIAGWRPFVIDPRSRFAASTRFPDAERVVVKWPKDALAEIGDIDRGTYVAVITHDPKLDDAALSLALESPAAYIGAMGSRRAQADRHARLLRLGYSEEALSRISAPIGLDLGAVSPEETAVSIVGELIAVRHGRGGGRLGDAKGRIHVSREAADSSLALVGRAMLG